MGKARAWKRSERIPFHNVRLYRHELVVAGLLIGLAIAASTAQ